MGRTIDQKMAAVPRTLCKIPHRNSNQQVTSNIFLSFMFSCYNLSSERSNSSMVQRFDPFLLPFRFLLTALEDLIGYFKVFYGSVDYDTKCVTDGYSAVHFVYF
jgi:hypothetical protein